MLQVLAQEAGQAEAMLGFLETVNQLKLTVFSISCLHAHSIPKSESAGEQ